MDNTGFLQIGKLRHRVVDTEKIRPGNHFRVHFFFMPCLIPNIEEGNGTQRPKHLLGESKWTKKTFTDTISVGKILHFVKMRPEKRKFKEKQFSAIFSEVSRSHKINWRGFEKNNNNINKKKKN